MASFPATNSTPLNQPAGCFSIILSPSALFGQPSGLMSPGWFPWQPAPPFASTMTTGAGAIGARQIVQPMIFLLNQYSYSYPAFHWM